MLYIRCASAKLILCAGLYKGIIANIHNFFLFQVVHVSQYNWFKDMVRILAFKIGNNLTKTVATTAATIDTPIFYTTAWPL